MNFLWQSDSLCVFTCFLRIFLIENNFHNNVFPKSFLKLLLTAIPGKFRVRDDYFLLHDIKYE